MKRFLILFTLIAFVTVSYAGPSKVKVSWTKPDFRQDQFENDRKECIDSIYQNLNSNAFGKALEECLEKQGYTYHSSQDAEESNKESTTKERLVTAGKTAGMLLLGVTLTALYIGFYVAMFAPKK